MLCRSVSTGSLPEVIACSDDGRPAAASSGGGRRWRGVAASGAMGLMVALGPVLPATSAAAGPKLSPGSRTLHDSLFPTIGNGGYDAVRYDLTLRWEPDRELLSGTSRMTARSTQALSRFNLDLVGLRVQRVSVDGERAGAQGVDEVGEREVDAQARRAGGGQRLGGDAHHLPRGSDRVEADELAADLAALA